MTDKFSMLLDIMDMLGYIEHKNPRTLDMILPLIGTLLENQIKFMDTGTIREKRGSGT